MNTIKRSISTRKIVTRKGVIDTSDSRTQISNEDFLRTKKSTPNWYDSVQKKMKERSVFYSTLEEKYGTYNIHGHK